MLSECSKLLYVLQLSHTTTKSIYRESYMRHFLPGKINITQLTQLSQCQTLPILLQDLQTMMTSSWEQNASAGNDLVIGEAGVMELELLQNQQTKQQRRTSSQVPNLLTGARISITGRHCSRAGRAPNRRTATSTVEETVLGEAPRRPSPAPRAASR